MRSLKLLSIILFSSLLLLACADNLDETLLHGNWSTKDWYILESGKKINNTMDFSFDSDRRYSIDYGSQKESGKYWVAVDYLHTVEDGKAEKKVKIISLSADTMVLEMNRAGQIERLLLTHP
jgi:hypothetical protein